MKNFLKLFLFMVAVSSSVYAADSTSVTLSSDTTATTAPQPDATQLTCQVGAVCFNQAVKSAKSNFHIEPGSVVRVEVNAKNGASISLVSGGNTMSASYLGVGTDQPQQQTVELESSIDKSGNFSLDVQVAKVTVNGKPQNANDGAYSLKITRVGAAKAASATSGQ